MSETPACMTRPCKTCPFLRSENGLRYLGGERMREIVDSDGGFPCHRTIEDTGGTGPKQECAGFLIYNLVNGSAPQLMRIMGRMGMIDEKRLLKARGAVFTDFDELAEAQDRGA